uniref:NADH dehydrogenase subunit 6 n=1 Tax=Histiostoma blomquisti TaxID=1902798 RepID=A0A342Y126_9ACAR|nr:NADH dehydrogenase subunit 6 [Histiostoma blomquisti]AOR08478.1 NADH dehydrogenase subunit 6 [Histiostoma blomquisti]
MGMMTMGLMMTLVLSKPSPLGFSFSLLMLSVWVSVNSMMQTGVLFSTSAIVLSFSTGMMILFCYCASMVNFETKNFSMVWMLLAMPLLSLLAIAEKEVEMTNEALSVMEYQTQFLTMAIMVVILSMVSINKSMFNPMKSSMSI